MSNLHIFTINTSASSSRTWNGKDEWARGCAQETRVVQTQSQTDDSHHGDVIQDALWCTVSHHLTTEGNRHISRFFTSDPNTRRAASVPLSRQSPPEWAPPLRCTRWSFCWSTASRVVPLTSKNEKETVTHGRVDLVLMSEWRSRSSPCPPSTSPADKRTARASLSESFRSGSWCACASPRCWPPLCWTGRRRPPPGSCRHRSPAAPASSCAAARPLLRRRTCWRRCPRAASSSCLRWADWDFLWWLQAELLSFALTGKIYTEILIINKTLIY